ACIGHRFITIVTGRPAPARPPPRPPLRGTGSLHDALGMYPTDRLHPSISASLAAGEQGRSVRGAAAQRSRRFSGCGSIGVRPRPPCAVTEDAAMVLPLARKPGGRLAAGGLRATAALEFGALPVVACV